MDATSPRWREIARSEFPWEREALAFVRSRLPDHDPYRAWSNFEFIGDDGSINEVDLLALTPKGFYLVEIKSSPGVVEGDQGTWTWRHDGRARTVDNPLLLANRKAKKLVALLRRQPALRQKAHVPFLEAHVFLSHADVERRLPEALRKQVHVRDVGAGRGERPGVVAALTRWSAGTPARTRPDRPLARALTRAMEQAGIRPSQRARQVGDYRLDELLLEGPGYQDWTAHHVAIDNDRARVRIYGLPSGVSDADRAALRRAAEREYQILQDVRHDGILAARGFTDHERGPALVFEHRPGAQRFDHWLAERAGRLDVDTRVHLLRGIAEAVRYAHSKRLVHRALAPQSILVLDPDAPLPQVRIFNWQTAARRALDTRTAGPVTSGATRLGLLVEEAAWIYMAPEAVTERGAPDEQSDVFSLGAVAWHLFAGRPPAASLVEMTERLRRDQGLRLSSVLDGVAEHLQRLVQYATHPEVTARLDSVSEFLDELERFEEEITAPEQRPRPDPIDARSGDELEHGLVVQRRLGQGSTALALLVERGGRELVLKVALSPERNARLEAEAEVLRRLRHQHVVELHDELRFPIPGGDGSPGGDRVGLLMARAGDATLADRIREEGRLHLELLERFGEDLLAAVDWLEQQGVPHRDVKPDNLGVAKLGGRMHLVLFDFSLSRTPAENLLAGTRHYLDPFLHERRPPRWDTYAERFSAAVTLHEMAAGGLPRWGDGRSEPAVLDCEATIDADAFEPAVREGLSTFFAQALRRDYRARFDNAQEMLRAWRQVFLAASLPETDSAQTRPGAAATAIDDATPDTALAALGLSARGLNAAERMNVRTAGDLLRFPLMRVNRMRGVGSRTRKELTALARRLAERFPAAAAAPKTAPAGGADETPGEAAAVSVDALQRELLPAGRTAASQRDAERLALLLGLRGAAAGLAWPNQSDAARELGIAPAGVSHAIARARRRWGKLPALTRLRHDLVALLDEHDQVMTLRELADALLAQRGSVQDEPLRSRHAAACVRAAVEVERQLAAPRWIVRRVGGPSLALIARDEIEEHGGHGALRIDGQKLADFAERLGRAADELAGLDPLLAPARVIEALQAVPAPAGVTPPASNRLPALAAAASGRAALSGRLELYPRGMAPERTLKLALGALAGARTLTPEAIRARVVGRYPDAAPLPDRPALDALLEAAGSELRWSPEADGGRGAYTSPRRTFLTIASGTSRTRTTGAWRVAEGDGGWDEGDDFEQRLRRALQQQAFLALIAAPRRLAAAERDLAAAFPIDVRSFDALLIRHMRDAARAAGADWRTVLRADRRPPDSSDRANLLRLVEHRALPRVRTELASAQRAVLLTNLGLLARYGQMTFIDGLRDAAGRAGGPPGVWLLIPEDEQETRPMLDGRPVPVFTPAQWARIPKAWLAGREQ